MNNPWLSLPETAPFVLDCDKRDILSFNAKAKPEYKVHSEKKEASSCERLRCRYLPHGKTFTSS